MKIYQVIMYYYNPDDYLEEEVRSLHIHRDAAIRAAKKEIAKAKTEASQSASIYPDADQPDDIYLNVVFSYGEASAKMISSNYSYRRGRVFSIEEAEVNEEE
jgi:hypothetical protein